MDMHVAGGSAEEARGLMNRMDELLEGQALGLPEDGAAQMQILLRKNRVQLALGDRHGGCHRPDLTSPL